jgi:hypothetical protein
MCGAKTSAVMVLCDAKGFGGDDEVELLWEPWEPWGKGLLDRLEGLVLLGLGRAAMSAFVFAVYEDKGRGGGGGVSGSLDAGGAGELRVGRWEENGDGNGGNGGDGDGDGDGSSRTSTNDGRRRQWEWQATAVEGVSVGVGGRRAWAMRAVEALALGQWACGQQAQPELGVMAAEASPGRGQ